MVFLMEVVSVGFKLTGFRSVCSLSKRSSRELLGKARLAALVERPRVSANSSKDADSFRSNLLSIMLRKLLLRKL